MRELLCNYVVILFRISLLKDVIELKIFIF